MHHQPTIESLKALLHTSPARTLTLHVLFVYDLEDTPVVDLQPQRAFFSQAAAEKAAAWIERGSGKHNWRVGYGAETQPAGYGTLTREFPISLDRRNELRLLRRRLLLHPRPGLAGHLVFPYEAELLN
jgi:hypothetical protein